MSQLSSWLKETIHLFYPHLCCACGNDYLEDNQLLCYQCISDLPGTTFADKPGNPIEKIFTGRINIEAAHSEFFFSKGQTVQQLIHQLKYKNNKDIGTYLGQVLGETLLQSNRFSNVDMIIPLPMFPDKEFKRGYNQATIIAKGMNEIMNIPVLDKLIVRSRKTETQTKKHRAERWLNVDGSFYITNESAIAGKHVLLIDDVITTGATLEACGSVILNIPGTKLSIATVAWTGN